MNIALRTLCSASLVWAGHAVAQTTDESDAVAVIDNIVVTGSAVRLSAEQGTLPNTTTVITREALEEQLALTTDLSSVIGNLVPAFSPSRQKLSSSGETLRGRKPLYLIDGVPQSSSLRNASRDGYTVDPSMIERIEVIHGANSLQGIGASGGLINIITRRPPTSGETLQRFNLRSSAPTDYESEGQSWQASYLAGRDFGAFDAIGGVAWEQRGLYYDGDGRAIGIDEVQGDLMTSSSVNLFAKLGYALQADQRVQLTLNNFDLEGDGNYVPVTGSVAEQRPVTSVRGDPDGDPPRNQVFNAALDYSHANLVGGELRAQMFRQRFRALFGATRTANFQDPRFGENIFDQSRVASDKTGLKLDWTRRGLFGGRFNGLIGFDFLRDETFQDLTQTGRLWVPRTEFDSVAPFAQGEWWFGDAVSVSGGLRFESGTLKVGDFRTLHSTNNDGGVEVGGGKQHFNEVLPNMGAVWHLREHLSLFASLAEGYTVPDFGRVLRAIGDEGQDVDTLIDLEPVIADNREIGIDYDNGVWLAHLSYYRSESDRGATLVFDADNQTFNVLRERVEINGWEVRGGWKPNASTRFDLGYAASRGRRDSTADGRVDSDLDGANIAPDRLNLNWTQQWTSAWASGLQLSHYVDRHFDALGERVARFDGYSTMDGYARLRTESLGDWTLGVENLTDKTYLTYFSQTVGRDTTIFSGRGRVVSLRWSYSL